MVRVWGGGVVATDALVCPRQYMTDRNIRINVLVTYSQLLKCPILAGSAGTTYVCIPCVRYVNVPAALEHHLYIIIFRLTFVSMNSTTGSTSSSKASPVGPHALIVVAPSSPRVTDRKGVGVRVHVRSR